MKYAYTPKIDIMGFEKNFAIFIPILLPKFNPSCSLLEPHVLFEIRSSSLRHQPSEICFPGGKIEHGESAEAAAIRETCEELLLYRKQLDVLTAVNLITTPTNRILQPYIGLLKQYEFSFSKEEVESVFLVPLSFFQNQEPELHYNHITITPSNDFPMEKMPNKKDYQFETGTYPVPFYEYEGHIIWGLTARIIKAALPRLEELTHELY